MTGNVENLILEPLRGLRAGQDRLENVMTTLEIKLNLPDQVALEAQRAGLLSDKAIARLIEEAVRREAGKRLLDAMALLREANVPPLTEEEIVAEVAAVRTARKTTGATGH